VLVRDPNIPSTVIVAWRNDPEPTNPSICRSLTI
jgi:hypothetical protein